MRQKNDVQGNDLGSVPVKWILPLLPVIALLVIWQVSSSLGLMNPALFPPPVGIVNELVDLHLQEMPARSLLLNHVGNTVWRALVALLMGAMVGIAVGVLMGMSELVYGLVDPLITVLMPIPGIAMAPLFVVWFGFGDSTIVALGTIAAFFPLAYSTAAGIRTVDTQLVHAAEIMGANKASVVFDVYLPWAAGHVLTGLKLGVARCWRTVIAVEFIAAASWGLGYMIWDAAEYLRAAVVYAGIAILVVLYLIIERGLLGLLERMTVEKWGMIRR